MRAAILIVGLLASFAAPAHAADKPFTDVAAYCQAAGNADAPDARYTVRRCPIG